MRFAYVVMQDADKCSKEGAEASVGDAEGFLIEVDRILKGTVVNKSPLFHRSSMLPPCPYFFMWRQMRWWSWFGGMHYSRPDHNSSLMPPDEFETLLLKNQIHQNPCLATLT